MATGEHPDFGRGHKRAPQVKRHERVPVSLRQDANSGQSSVRRTADTCPMTSNQARAPRKSVVIYARLVCMTKPKAATALIVIDVQESALRDCPNIDEVIANVNLLVGRGRAAGCPVIFVQHDDPDDPDMAAGSAGWQLSRALDRLDTDTVMPKTYRDAFAATDLDDLLARAGSQQLVLMGVHSDFCEDRMPWRRCEGSTATRRPGTPGSAGPRLPRRWRRRRGLPGAGPAVLHGKPAPPGPGD